MRPLPIHGEGPHGVELCEGLSSARQQVQKDGEDQAQKDAGYDWEVEREASLAHEDISRQAGNAEPSHQKDEPSKGCDQHTENDEALA